ncbi:MAG TPA: hypothetical protein DCX07_06025, partial [Phycisphaerales bacterium]|nr:hypothetical protein [Phycisphaerales bacterium]
FDGRIASADLHDELAARFGPRHVFSASQLSAYGQCPWQFFAAYVLDLRPLEAPARRMEAVALGVFCHNVLFRVYSVLRD